MKTTLEWIRAFTPVDQDPKAFADGMTLTGSKVESIQLVGGAVQGIRTGRIDSVAPHPNADKLVCCQLTCGERKLQIVTGADNVFAGAIVPVALDGASLADGTVIRAGTLRGEPSQGMLCSLDELGLDPEAYPETDPDGIVILPDDTPLDADIRPILHLDDVILEFEITANRPDCLSVEGLAREAAVTFDRPFSPLAPQVQALDPSDSADHAAIEILDPDLCPRYCGRVIQDVTIGPSPDWIRRRLRGAGMRPINNLVDITNYVMLELGQPMHAFDLSQLAGSQILVRRARAGERMTTLDGIERTLDPSMLVIADQERVVALAGVMGAENSEVSADTTRILLESATFDAAAVRSAAKQVGLRTEASLRFEKGLDRQLARRAMDRACQLIEETGAGRVCQSTLDVWPGKQAPRQIPFTTAGINGILGTDLTEDWLIACLERLGIQVQLAGDGLLAWPPSWRADLVCQADLAEEAARLYGYNKIEPSLLSGAQATTGGLSRDQTRHEKIKGLFLAAGFFEASTYSFEGPAQLDKLRVPQDHPLRQQVIIHNPLGEEYSRMRTSMLPSLLTVASTNWKRSVAEAALFESAAVYRTDQWPLTALPTEERRLCACRYDTQIPDAGPGLFFALKGLVEELARHLGIQDLDFFPEADAPWLHPGRAARVTLAGQAIGQLGEVHPDVARAFSAPPRTVLLDLSVDALIQAARDDRQAVALPRYPRVLRDLSLVANKAIPAREIDAIIRRAGGGLLRAIRLFDAYAGKPFADDEVSLSYELAFGADDKTLSDEDIAPVIEAILDDLARTIGAHLRDR